MRLTTVFVLLCILALSSGLIFGRKKKKPKRPKKHVSSCGRDWFDYGASCYKMFGNSLPFDKAEKECVKRNAHLASMNNAMEYAFILVHLPKNVVVWTGMKDIKLKKGKIRRGRRVKNGLVLKSFKWTDGSSTKFKTFLGSFSSKSKAATVGVIVKKIKTIKKRGIFRTKKKNKVTMKFMNTAPGKIHPFICEKSNGKGKKIIPKKPKKSSKCESGWSNHMSRCYKLFKTVKHFADAEADCAKNQGHLVSINHKPELQFVAKLLPKKKGLLSSTPKVWIGMKNIKLKTLSTFFKKYSLKSFDWTDGSGTKFVPTGKFANRPLGATFGAISRQTAMFKKSVTGSVSNVPPKPTKLPYICEKPEKGSYTSTQGPATTGNGFFHHPGQQPTTTTGQAAANGGWGHGGHGGGQPTTTANSGGFHGGFHAG